MQGLATLRQTLDIGTSLAKGHHNSGKRKHWSRTDSFESSDAGDSSTLAVVWPGKTTNLEGNNKAQKIRTSLRGTSCMETYSSDRFLNASCDALHRLYRKTGLRVA